MGKRIAALLLLAGLGGCREMDLRKCDEALQEKLKAPSTYQRISVQEAWQKEAPKYTITYEAQNAFGVPLRGEAICYLDTAREDVRAFP